MKRLTRYRFSLAHEVGHWVLHADIFRQLHIDSIVEWKHVITTLIPEREYGYLEFHGSSFAGLVLVPPKELRQAFFDCVEEGQKQGIDFDETETGAREAVEAPIARIFDVSPEVIGRRVKYDKLWHE